VLVSMLVAVSCRAEGGLKAYYTKIDSGAPFAAETGLRHGWEKYSRTGPYADIVVKVGEIGKFVFHRSSSYLGYWQSTSGKKYYIDEIVKRSGDGSDKMPDKINAFSRVKIVQKSPEKVKVHWRYEPNFRPGNPKKDINPLDFVDEYFTIHSDGRMERTIRQGTPGADEWNDTLNKKTYQYKLSGDGIVQVDYSPPKKKSSPVTIVKGNPKKSSAVGEPNVCFKFDEGKGDTTTETVSGYECRISGHKSYWKKGVSGTCLAFDGYTSKVTFPGGKVPWMGNNFTIECWAAIGAYPWKVAPIVAQGDLPGRKGFYLGVDHIGRLVFKLRKGSNWDLWYEFETSEGTLSRWQWHHIAVVFENKKNLVLYVDGKEVLKVSPEKSSLSRAKDEDLVIGLNGAKMLPARFNRSVKPTLFGFDGLIDELRIYTQPLGRREIERLYSSFDPGEELRSNPDMDSRELPGGGAADEFGARYTKLKFYDTWDNLFRDGDYVDVVVDFDELPIRFVFWRGLNFAPAIVNEKNEWMNNEFNETWNENGCCEPMQDTAHVFNHVRIIENTPARAVVHYRYAVADILGKFPHYDKQTGWGDWAEMYYYIYPDGVAAKKMVCWSDTVNHEWQETLVIYPPGKGAEDILDTQECVTLANLEGEANVFAHSGELKRPDDSYIQLVNYRGGYDPFVITGGAIRKVRPFWGSWNHWPVGQVLCDGRVESVHDRTGHSACSNLYWPLYKDHHEELAPYRSKVMLVGMTDKQVSELAVLAKSWLHPAKAEDAAGCTLPVYDMAQRAYVMEKKGPEAVSFSLKASEKNPIVNPCFVINGWGDCESASELKINGISRPSGVDFREGVVTNGDGKNTVVIWLDFEYTSTAGFEIAR